MLHMTWREGAELAEQRLELGVAERRRRELRLRVEQCVEGRVGRVAWLRGLRHGLRLRNRDWTGASPPRPDS
jgi:hypothetical protein